jgi:hypothetical protein
MTCNVAACYRKQPVEDKSYPVDFKAGRIFGEPQAEFSPLRQRETFSSRVGGHLDRFIRTESCCSIFC